MNVAITQNRISAGGRLSVILALVKVLNKNNIVPDLLTFKLNVSEEDLTHKYGNHFKFNLRIIRLGLLKKLPELDKLWFNFILNVYAKNYDFIIDSNNTTALLFHRKKLISYIHFPRKARFTNAKIKFAKDFKATIFAMEKLIARVFYRIETLEALKVIANSEYTKKIIQKNFNVTSDWIEVVYPPIDVEQFSNSNPKKDQVISIGRFMPDKMQIEQIKVAEKFPSLMFHIIGFVSATQESTNYYQRCSEYIQKNNVKNVLLHANCKYEDMKNIMFESKYFLHMLKEEPFGITTVQAIAAGCLPIVPNSGGQVDIVPIDKLRWDQTEDIIAIINQLKHKNIEAFIEDLQDHIKKFKFQEFINNMSEIFMNVGLINRKTA